MIGIDLSGRTILMTGALEAIAEHMVRKLSDAGATLALTDIKADEAAQRTLDEWSIARASYSYFAADITDVGAVERLIERTFERWPALDTVLGHAGADAASILLPAHPWRSMRRSFASTILRRPIWRARPWRNGRSAGSRAI